MYIPHGIWVEADDRCITDVYITDVAINTVTTILHLVVACSQLKSS